MWCNQSEVVKNSFRNITSLLSTDGSPLLCISRIIGMTSVRFCTYVYLFDGAEVNYFLYRTIEDVPSSTIPYF
uniref:Uncharacterized protein n=1 Tax=Pararge aegeria TaxID=116150 RepID=S4PXF7_9NEOP